MDTEKIIEKLQEAQKEFKDRWDNDNDKQAAGCYKALNAIIASLQSENNEYDDYYIFTRLIEAISWLADFYETDLNSALSHGGCGIVSHSKTSKGIT